MAEKQEEQQTGGQKVEEEQPDPGADDGVERMDAPNQQAVGQPHPSEEGTGGEEGDIEQANFAFDDDEPADQPDTGETDAKAEEEKKPRGRPRKSG